MRTPERILRAFRSEKKLILAVHINPDGDALGAALALAEALETLGKEVLVYSRDPVPEYYRFLPGNKRISPSKVEFERGKAVLVLVDCNAPERAGLEGLTFGRTIVVDHHETERDFGDIRWVDRKAAATGLMVYRLIRSLGVPFTKEMATNLYAAISVDTGTFRYSNTTAEVLRASAALINAGADAGRIADSLYETWKNRRFRLLILALNTLEIRDGVALIHVTREMFRKTGSGPEDTENFSNFPRMIDSVKIAALLRETEKGRWKVSLRSKGAVNVAKVAELFGGGGHRNAAGFRITADLVGARAALLNAARKTGVLRVPS